MRYSRWRGRRKSLKNNVIVIPLPLMSLNQYIQSERGNRFGGAKVKKQATATCQLAVKAAMNKGVRFSWDLPLQFDWYWYNKRTDPDNIAFQHKFIFDGMMAAGFLDNDNWAHIHGFVDTFAVDKANPRVEITEVNMDDKFSDVWAAYKADLVNRVNMPKKAKK